MLSVMSIKGRSYILSLLPVVNVSLSHFTVSHLRYVFRDTYNAISGPDLSPLKEHIGNLN